MGGEVRTASGRHPPEHVRFNNHQQESPHEQNHPKRPVTAGVLEADRPGRGGLGPDGGGRPPRPCRGKQHHPGGPDRVRRPGHGRGGQCHVGQGRPGQAGGDGRRLREPPEEQYRKPEQTIPQAGRRAAGPAVHRLRRVPEGDGLSEARRHRDFRHAAGVPLGTLRLRHPEGAERLHGEAADGGRSDFAQDDQARRRGDGEEPQGGGGLDVPPQPGARGAGQAHPRRPDRRHHPDARLPDARTDRGLCVAAETARRQRSALPGAAIPQLPVGGGRVLQRFQHPHHRPVRLDEERLAGQGPGPGRPPL